MYFSLTAHLKSDTKFSLEIFKFYVDILKFTVEKVDSYTRIVTNILSFPMTKLSV